MAKQPGCFSGLSMFLYLQPALSIDRALTSETLHIIIKKENDRFNFKYPVISKGGIKTNPEQPIISHHTNIKQK